MECRLVKLVHGNLSPIKIIKEQLVKIKKIFLFLRASTSTVALGPSKSLKTMHKKTVAALGEVPQGHKDMVPRILVEQKQQEILAKEESIQVYIFYSTFQNNFHIYHFQTACTCACTVEPVMSSHSFKQPTSLVSWFLLGFSSKCYFV